MSCKPDSFRMILVLGLVVLAFSSVLVGDDCNSNDIDDACDIDCDAPGCNVPGCGESSDCNSNGVPDECELRGLFAGTQDGGAGGDAKVYRYVGGTGWEDITPSPAWDVSAVMDLAYFDGHLYAGIQTEYGYGGEDGQGQVWRRNGGTSWTMVSPAGGLDNSVMVLEVLAGYLYAGTDAGNLYRCSAADDQTWVLVPRDQQKECSGFRSGIVSSLCGEAQLFLGELDRDDFWRFTELPDLVREVDDQSGSCIWDFAEFDGRLYAGAYYGIGNGPVYRSPASFGCDDEGVDLVSIHQTGRLAALTRGAVV